MLKLKLIMTLAYLVTEGKSDVDILNKLIPDRYLTNTQLVVGGSKYSAQSLAGTILAAKSLPVALVIDADTDNESAIQEKSESVCLIVAISAIASKMLALQVYVEQASSLSQGWG